MARKRLYDRLRAEYEKTSRRLLRLPPLLARLEAVKQFYEGMHSHAETLLSNNDSAEELGNAFLHLADLMQGEKCGPARQKIVIELAHDKLNQIAQIWAHTQVKVETRLGPSPSEERKKFERACKKIANVMKVGSETSVPKKALSQLRRMIFEHRIIPLIKKKRPAELREAFERFEREHEKIDATLDDLAQKN